MEEKNKISKFITSKGVEVFTQPVNSMMVHELELTFKHAEKPTYFLEVKGPNGKIEKEVIEHDDNTDKTPEQLLEWEEYKRLERQYESENSEKIMRFLLSEGIRNEPDNAWIEKAEYYGIKVPENVFERKYFYITKELLSDNDDFSNALECILSASGTPKEVVTQLVNSFRAGIQENISQRFQKASK